MKGELHPRNRHKGRYDFDKLIEAYPSLEPFVAKNKYGDLSIDFFDPKAVLALNRAILALYYDIHYWEIPSNALTPPIPGRADYIHYLADLIGAQREVRCLDVGVGANCIYPIIGVKEYGWNFVGSDIDLTSVESARRIVENNQLLESRVEIRHQQSSSNIFEGVIKEGEHFDLTMCNPPFHDSAKSANAAASRKLRNLKGGGRVKGGRPELNFAGRSNELWCEGGELSFISNMIKESYAYRKNCTWFTTLVSNEDNLLPLIKKLNSVGAKEYKKLEMSQGNKRSRVLAWRFI